MEELARQGVFDIQWNGKNVTTNLKPFLSSVTYTDHEEGAADDITIELDNGEGLWSGDWYPEEGDTLELKIGYSDALMSSGLFQVDEMGFSGSPHIIEVKSISSFITKSLRTKNSKAFEAQTLNQISLFFCKKHGLKLIDNSKMLSQIYLERKTQEEKTDLQFLSELAKEYGFLFSVKGNNLVFTSFYDLDNAPAVRDISVFQLSNYSITEKTWDTYQGAQLFKRDPKTNTVSNQYETFDGKTVKEDLLLVTGTGGNKKTVEAKVKAGLWNKNRFKQAGNINDLPGDPSLVAGMNINLTGLGNISGVYHITTATHKISGDGAYTTSLEVRKTGSIPKPKRVPPTKQEKPEYDANDMDYDNGGFE